MSNFKPNLRPHLLPKEEAPTYEKFGKKSQKKTTMAKTTTFARDNNKLRAHLSLTKKEISLMVIASSCLRTVGLLLCLLCPMSVQYRGGEKQYLFF